jgi:hypothetical protein
MEDRGALPQEGSVRRAVWIVCCGAALAALAADEAHRPSAPDLPPHGVVMNAVLCVADDLHPVPRPTKPEVMGSTRAPSDDVKFRRIRLVDAGIRPEEIDGGLAERCRPLCWTVSAAGLHIAKPPRDRAGRPGAAYIELDPEWTMRLPQAARAVSGRLFRMPEMPVWPLLVGTEALAERLVEAASSAAAGRSVAASARPAVEAFEVARTADDGAGLLCLDHGRLRVWRATGPLPPSRAGEGTPPGRWRQADKLKWASKELFRALPGGKTWWFVTSSQALWTAPMQGKVDREVTKARELGKERLATLIDRDLGRSFIFGDGWYLDLGDEAKLVKEPRAKWPRPAKDAPDIERLRVYRSWVGRP